MRRCKRCRADISYRVKPGPGRPPTYCDPEVNPDCRRERDRLRQQKSRATTLRPRENHWDPVAQREIPARHARGTSEYDEGGTPGRYERIQLAAEQRTRTFKLVERIGCQDCAEAYLRYGYGARCLQHGEHWA
jgi:hypothetical protein